MTLHKATEQYITMKRSLGFRFHSVKGVNPNIVLFWIDSAELKGQECSRAAPDSNRICGSDLPCPQSR
jgi:hypothetical protein